MGSCGVCESLVYNAPKYRCLLILLINKILEKTNFVQWLGVRIPFTIFTNFRYPIFWLTRVYYIKQFGWVKIWFSSIVQYSVVICLYANNKVRLICGQVGIAGILCFKRNNHFFVTTFSLVSNLPIP